MIWFMLMQLCSILLQGIWLRRKSEQKKALEILVLRRQLAKLGYELSDETVAHILKRHGIPPAPERQLLFPFLPIWPGVRFSRMG